jgi:DNA-binding MarR family transcriptional regulator
VHLQAADPGSTWWSLAFERLRSAADPTDAAAAYASRHTVCIMYDAMTDEREILMPSPDPVVLELERLARVLVAATGVAIEEGSPATGLTVQQWRIHVILARAGALRLREVAMALHASQPSASRLVHRLERAGLVERVPASDDGRGIFVHLTSDGMAVHDAVVARRREMLETSLRALQVSGDIGPSLRAIATALEALV